ncbi:unnamed protein product [Allacma fusca]|uniref:Uncharacterized protein n=1 Tax=Allacma fusca TaxID=39272 RepID=A0A8J2P614_9HEXA|nr:unnamed protein product [Allacma fusca]
MTDPFDFSKAKLPQADIHYGFSSKSKIPVPESPFLSSPRAGFLADLSDELFFDEHGVPIVEPIPKTLDKPPPYSYGTPGILYDPSSVPRKSISPTLSIGGAKKKWRKKKPPDALERTHSDLIEKKLQELLGGGGEELSDAELASLREKLSKSADDISGGDALFEEYLPGVTRLPTPEERRQIEKLIFTSELSDPKIPLPRLPQLPIEEKPKPGSFAGSAKSLLKASRAFAKAQSLSSDNVSKTPEERGAEILKRLSGSLPSMSKGQSATATGKSAAAAFRARVAKPGQPLPPSTVKPRTQGMDMVQIQAMKMLARQGIASSDEDGLAGSGKSRDSSMDRSSTNLMAAGAFKRRGAGSRDSSTEGGRGSLRGAVSKTSVFGGLKAGDQGSSRESSTERGRHVVGAVGKATSFVRSTERGKEISARASAEASQASATGKGRKGTKKSLRAAAAVTSAAAASAGPKDAKAPEQDTKTGSVPETPSKAQGKAKDAKATKDGTPAKDSKTAAAASKTTKAGQAPAAKDAKTTATGKAGKPEDKAKDEKSSKTASKGLEKKSSVKGASTATSTSGGKKTDADKGGDEKSGKGLTDTPKTGKPGTGASGTASGGGDEDPSKPPPEVIEKPPGPPKKINSVALRVLMLSSKSDWHGVDQALRYLEKAIVMDILSERKPLAGVADEKNGWSPLMYALKDNRIPMADRMLDLGCDVNHRNLVRHIPSESLSSWEKHNMNY